ncbi:MAG: glycosyltransferase [Selenomonadaceae bacterium]|nr:glycosyltransferase [Selenomonadaceae bacterium]
MLDISVIIPVYNSEKYLNDCLDSILSQDLSNIEVICWDDGSTDNSRQILVDYEARDSRVVVLGGTNNLGQAYARNQGISVAKGKYIFFVDADDMVKPNALQEMKINMDNHNIDGLLFDADVIYECDEMKNYLISKKREHEYNGIFTGSVLFARLLSYQEYDMVVWRQCWKRDYLIKNNIFFQDETAPHEDNLFTFKAILCAPRMSLIHKSLYTHRRRKGSSTASNITPQRFISHFLVYCETVKFIYEKSLNINSACGVMDDIYKYILSRKNLVKKYLVNLFHQGVSIQEIEFNIFDKLTFYMYFNQDYKYIDEFFVVGILHKIRNYKHIIVYGAGYIGRDTVAMLIEYGFNNFYVSVTELQGNNHLINMEIHEIKSLQPIQRDSFVLIAAQYKHYPIMRQNLITLGFKNYCHVLYPGERKIW